MTTEYTHIMKITTNVIVTSPMAIVWLELANSPLSLTGQDEYTWPAWTLSHRECADPLTPRHKNCSSITGIYFQSDKHLEREHNIHFSTAETV